jgi:hypothetical protein
MTIFYSILFTPRGLDRNPKANQYVNCLQLQLEALKRTGMLGPSDKYYVLADADTAAVLRETPNLGHMRVVEFPASPPHVRGGMGFKYLFPSLVDTGDETVVYLDLDVFPVKPAIITAEPDTFYAYPEGSPTDTNYSGGRPLDLPAGCSGGFFVYRQGPRVKAFFEGLLNAVASDTEEHYTLDQPAYNHFLAQHKDLVKFLPHTLLSFNGNVNRQEAIFFNMCGDPGDGPFHFRKMLGVFLVMFSDTH